MPLDGFRNHVFQAFWSPSIGKGLSDHQQIMEEKNAYTVEKFIMVFLFFDPETPSLLVS